MSRRITGYLLLLTALLFVVGGLFRIAQSSFWIADAATPAQAAQDVPESPLTPDTPVTAESLTGHYSIGAGSARTDLSLSSSGTFVMRSRASLGTGRKVHGEWRLDGNTVVLWSSNGRAHRWALEAMATRGGFDLVPEELVDLYRESPRNIGVRYRRVSLVSADESPTPVVAAVQRREAPLAKAKASPTPIVKRIAKVVPVQAPAPAPRTELTPFATSRRHMLRWTCTFCTDQGSPGSPSTNAET